MRLVTLTTDEVAVLVRLKVGHPHNDLFRRECRPDGGNPFGQLVHVEIDRAGVTGNALLDGGFEVGRQAVKFQQGLGVNPDLAVDDKFEPRQAYAFVRQLAEVKRQLRVAHVHHQLNGAVWHFVQREVDDFDFEQAVVDVAGIAFGARHRHSHAIFQQGGRIATAHNSGNAKFTGNNRCVAGTTTTVGDDSSCTLHNRFPIGVGHVGDQHVAGFDAVHFGRIFNHPHHALTDFLANGTACDQDGAVVLQAVAAQGVHAGFLRFHGFRTGLQNVELAVDTVFAPLDIHRTRVVLFDNQGKASEFFDIDIGQGELGL